MPTGSNGNGSGYDRELADESSAILRHVAGMDEFTPATKRLPPLDEAVEKFIGAGGEWFDPIGVLERRMDKTGLANPLQNLALRGLGKTIAEGRAAFEDARRRLM